LSPRRQRFVAQLAHFFNQPLLGGIGFFQVAHLIFHGSQQTLNTCTQSRMTVEAFP
jgi:hypothetical protein